MNTKKTIIFAVVAAIVFGFTMSAGAATITAVKVKGAIPTDPSSLFWSERYGPTALKHVIIDMDPQMITNPMWPNPTTKWVFVKAANNGKEIAVHLEWTDATRDDIFVTSQQYKDQVAIMFPVNQSGEEPPFTMGGDGERVNIWQWKATWDKEGAGRAGNEALQDMEDQYDFMALGSGGYYMYEPDGKLQMKSEFSFKTGSKDRRDKSGSGTQGASDISKRGSMVDYGMGRNEGVFNPGIATYNILSDNTMRRSPVEDLNAEGFGSLTSQAHQDVDGKGNWNNDRWTVVFKRALKTKDVNDTQFSGNKTPMAIAIWNGQNKERNGQKAVTQWHTLRY